MTTRFKSVSNKNRHLNGWKKDRPDPRDKLYKAPFWERLRMPNIAVIPQENELRVEDQGDIGSCTCNSGTTGIEYLMLRDGARNELSRLYPYAKVRLLEGTPLTEDSGAQIRDVMKVLSSYGSPFEAAWPYDAQKWTIDPPSSLDAEAGKHKLTFYYRCPTLMTIMASISQGYPVVGGFTCFESMFTDQVSRTGFIPMPRPDESTEGGHAVIFTGYNRSTRMLRFLNSWGTGWGERGFGYLPFGYVIGGLADDFWTQRRAGK